MYNGFGKKPKFAIAASMLMAAILLGTTAISSITTAESVYAYRNNQAASQANDCGNGSVPIDTVLCQNTGSQIQGDKNTAALSSQQTFPEPPTETPDPCEDCLAPLLDFPGLAIDLAQVNIAQNTQFSTDEDAIEAICEALENGYPVDAAGGPNLAVDFTGAFNVNPEIDPVTAENLRSTIIECLNMIFGA
jgi:hypothetical protein